MAAVNVARTVATAVAGAWLLAADAMARPAGRPAGAPDPLGLMPQPEIPAVTAAPMATRTTMVLMRRHMSIFATPKDWPGTESRHPSIGSQVIWGNDTPGLMASGVASEMAVQKPI
jgi:hypothetical protein